MKLEASLCFSNVLVPTHLLHSMSSQVPINKAQKLVPAARSLGGGVDEPADALSVEDRVLSGEVEGRVVRRVKIWDAGGE